jgi:glucose-6-phosphate 1-dehydrogenase
MSPRARCSTVCDKLPLPVRGPGNRSGAGKPLGHDLASNRPSTRPCAACWPSSRYSLDHYLGKPSVQNLFALRFGNALFEPIWNRDMIANMVDC